ncbi:MAG: glutamate--tRNA ligase [Candidatus Yanofskybacteria bacterium RIFCSPHIGHO2_02_FULL_41_11]|uniref:Glutamate--tRNA ligase n=1 Tax=Candidatus Yanofskybacteria bacterium RIFCSPHIGHO2_02_FULL_41_11 TaxID=1802675 RepID=A0A1F8F4W7_9BACT|nr:MAG: glutamate--tRNA ligase [Candidatus Yanofskybacteria bacterium RIFCSPHIGHO2_02_FULL_41_11]
MVRVRFAPSPTGYLHIGGVRSALFNWLFARNNGGVYILRIDDTDIERNKKEYEDDILNSFKWAGLEWDEFYKQSDRADIYEKYLKELLDSNKAFWCYHTIEELEAEQKEQAAKKEAPRHVCHFKYNQRSTPNHPAKARATGQATNGQRQDRIIRLAVNENSTRILHFEDEIRGIVEWEERLIGDFSLAKDLKTPLYNFTTVIDDFELGISHVIRGEEHISNTPRQLLIYEAIDKPVPKFAHLPLILGTDKSKLSKRNSAVPIADYKKDYLPEALINFLGFLGYTYSKEIISKEEMAKEFDLKKVHRSGAVFNTDKLNWINSQYIKSLSANKLVSLSAFKNVPDKAIPLITERLEKLSDVQNFDYFWKEPEYDRELLKWKKSTLAKSVETLTEVKKVLEEFDFEKSKDELRKLLDDFSEKKGDRGLVYWPFRVALTGRDKSPDPVDVAFVLGKEKTLERVRKALLNFT